MERRAHYHLMRMNWLSNPFIDVQPWQVEDYRELSLETILDRLQDLGLPLDRVSFSALADETETPEELTERLLADLPVPSNVRDQIYLLLFELWRRFVPEKLCLSIFCDELDHQIDLYDRGEQSSTEAIQDILANLAVILDENMDEGVNPNDVFASICKGCANDVESFLYDFIADQIDSKNASYAADLLEDFQPYVQDSLWFDLLQARVTAMTDVPRALALMRKLLKQIDELEEYDFYLEVLAFLAQLGNKELFLMALKQALPLLKVEEEFQDLLATCAEFLLLIDDDQAEAAVQEILQQRVNIPMTQPFDARKAPIPVLLDILK